MEQEQRRRRTSQLGVPPSLHSVNDFCRATGISRAQGYALMKAGLVRYIMVGKQRKITDLELKRVLSQGTAPAPAPTA